MASSRSHSFLSRSIKGMLFAALLGGSALTVLADPPKSLLPVFGNEGAEFTVKAKDGHIVKGWLPKDWNDNSDWAPVTATYSKLTDSPDKDAGAVRIKIEKVDEGGLLQMTTYQGNANYKKGVHYVISGWVRSADRLLVTVGPRMNKEPYEFYFQQDLTSTPEWKRFEFAFTPEMDIEALTMFAIHDAGTVDLAGIAVEEKP